MGRRKKEKAPAFQLYTNDWLGSTTIALMSPAQEGAYIRLLCHAWNDPDCSLPDDDAQLAVLSRLNDEWFNSASLLLRRCFPVHPNKPGRLINKRLAKYREELKRKQRAGAAGGRKSGQVRGLRDEAKAKQKRSKSEAKGKTSSSTSSSTSKKNTPYSPPFDSIEFPEGWDTPEVRQAIADWLEYKRGRKQKYQDPAMQISRLLKIEDDGARRFPTPAAFVAGVNASIANNYSGCYPPGRTGRKDPETDGPAEARGEYAS